MSLIVARERLGFHYEWKLPVFVRIASCIASAAASPPWSSFELAVRPYQDPAWMIRAEHAYCGRHGQRVEDADIALSVGYWSVDAARELISRKMMRIAISAYSAFMRYGRQRQSVDLRFPARFAF